MQKKWMMLVVVILLLGFGGCGSQRSVKISERTDNKDNRQEKITEICAYIKEIKGDILVIDPVEFISSEDSDQFASYKHTDDDAPDGYYIYNEDVKTKNMTLTGQTEYSFLDWTREFGGTDADIRVTTRDKKIFQKYLETYTDAKPGMPFFLKVKGKKVIGIWEKPMA